MELSIISFNIQNKIKNKNYDGGTYPKILSKLVKQTEIICLQELTDAYEKKLQTLMPNYQFTGQNRFSKKSLWYNHFGEKTAIITTLNIINTQIYSLSKNINNTKKRSFLSIFPRIATLTTVKKNKQNFTIINTHLDHLTNISRKKQLNYLKNIIEQNNKYPIILTGDFNLNTENKIFKNFIKYMNTQNCKLVPLKENTLKTKRNKIKTPDHIFIPKNFNIQNINIINSPISDHKLIKINIKTLKN